MLPGVYLGLVLGKNQGEAVLFIVPLTTIVVCILTAILGGIAGFFISKKGMGFLPKQSQQDRKFILLLTAAGSLIFGLKTFFTSSSSLTIKVIGLSTDLLTGALIFFIIARLLLLLKRIITNKNKVSLVLLSACLIFIILGMAFSLFDIIWKPNLNSPVSTTVYSDNANPGNSDNTNSNFSNGLEVAKKGDWLFYSNFNDDNTLYKQRIDKSGNTKLSDDVTCDYIQFDRDWIYYCAFGGLYRIKPDGTGRALLVENADTAYIYGNYVYYTTDEKSDLYMAKLDGSEKTFLEEGYIQNINIYDGWVYYLNNQKNENFWETNSHKEEIWKMRLDGSETAKVGNIHARAFTVENGWVYYVNGGIYRMRVDGSNSTRIGTDKSYQSINVLGDWIYYQDWKDNGYDNDSLCKMKIDGSGKTVLNHDFTEYIIIHDGWIYFTSEEPNPINAYKMRLDGSAKTTFHIKDNKNQYDHDSTIEFPIEQQPH